MKYKCSECGEYIDELKVWLIEESGSLLHLDNNYLEEGDSYEVVETLFECPLCDAEIHSFKFYPGKEDIQSVKDLIKENAIL